MRTVADTRPVWQIIVDKSSRIAAFGSLVMFFLLILNLPLPNGLSPEALKTLAIFAVCAILWTTELIPMAVTSLLAIILIPLLGIMETHEAYALFGNKAVFFILGAFILSASLLKSGLSSRVALKVLHMFGATPKKLLMGIFFTTAFMSFWMPEHAVAAMLFSVVMEVAKSLDLKPLKSTYGRTMFLAMAWGASIGGISTFLGGARNVLAISILKETTGLSIGFFEWMVAVVPISLVMMVAGYFYILMCYKKDEIKDVTPAKKALEKKIEEMGEISLREKMVGLIMILTVLAWMFLGETLELANIAIVAAVLLFVFGLMTWKDAENTVNWGIILMYGGAITLGMALEKTGAAAWLANLAISNLATSSFIIVIVFSLISIWFTEGISNSAVVAMMLPVGIGIATHYGLDVRVMVYAIAVPAGLAFALPIGTPPNAIAFSSGYIKSRDMLRLGLVLNFISWLVFVTIAKFYWPLIGLNF